MATVRQALFAALGLFLLSPAAISQDKTFSLGSGICQCDPGDKTKASKAKSHEILPLLVQLTKANSTKDPFGPKSGLGLTPIEAEKRVQAMRDAVKRLVEFASKALSKPCQKWLQEQCNQGNIVIEWAPFEGKAAHIPWDSKSEKTGSELIVLNGQLLAVLTEPDREIKQLLPMCADPFFVLMSAVVAHEVTHAGQSNGTEAGGLRDAAQNEVSAHGVSKKYLEDWLATICDPDNVDFIVNDRGAPSSKNPCFKKAIQKWGAIWQAFGLLPADRQKLLDILKKRVKGYIQAECDSIECYTFIKDRLDEVLGGTITPDEFKEALREGETWKSYIDRYFDSRALEQRDYFLQIGSGGVIHQSVLPFHPVSRVGPVPSFPTGLSKATSLALVRAPAAPLLLVSGVAPSGLGELLVYSDTDGDGWFDPASRRVLFSSEPRMGPRVEIFCNGDQSAWYVFDASRGAVMELADTDGDSVPDQLREDVMIASPDLQSLAGFVIDPYSPVPTMVGKYFSDFLAPRAGTGLPIHVLEDKDGDGFFETGSTVSVVDQYGFPPRFEPRSLVHQSTAISAYGAQGVTLQAWQSDPATGDRLALLGAALGAGPDSPAIINLSSPLLAGDSVELSDASGADASVFAYVSGTESTAVGPQCPSSAGLPELGVTSVPDIGSDIRFALSGAPPSAPVFFAFGFGLANLDGGPFGAPGCILYPNASALVGGVADGTGLTELHLPAPADPVLIGVVLRSQGIVLDPLANLLGLASSNGLDIAVGGRR